MSENPNLSTNLGETDCEILQALLPAYSIGATDEEETQLVESLLPLCPEVAAELPEYLALSGALVQTVPPAIPPAALHDKLMALTASTAAPGTLVSHNVPAAPAAPVTPLRVVPQNRFWISAAAALLVLLIVSNAYWATITNQIRQAQAAFSDQLDQQNVLIAGITSGNVLQVALNSSEGNARVFWNAQEEVAMLATEGLPLLSQDQTYQLWLISGETPVSAGTFIVDDTGRAIFFFDPAQNMTDYDAVGISTEPAGGSESPTTTPIAVGEI